MGWAGKSGVPPEGPGREQQQVGGRLVKGQRNRIQEERNIETKRKTEPAS